MTGPEPPAPASPGVLPSPAPDGFWSVPPVAGALPAFPPISEAFPPSDADEPEPPSVLSPTERSLSPTRLLQATALTSERAAKVVIADVLGVSVRILFTHRHHEERGVAK